MKNKVLQMIDESFDDFDFEHENEKNIKMLLSFKNSSLNYNEREFKIPNKPKLKKKFRPSVYIKNTNKNQLF